MPIGIVSDSQFEEELKNTGERTRTPPKVIDIPKKGRQEGSTQVPDSLRKVIAEDALLNGRQSALQLAADFNISPSSVSAYTNGATSTTSYNEPSKSILSHINQARDKAIKKASRTLNQALASITQDKLDYTDADKLSGIAKDMSVIIKNLEPKQESSPDSLGAQRPPQFIIYAPQFKKEESFEVINVVE